MLFFMRLVAGSMAVMPMVYAHTGITNLFVNGVDQGDLMCLRSPADVAKFTFPVEDLGSPDMACGHQGTTGVKRACPVPDGAALTFQYRKAPGDPSQGALDTTHVGPCAVYLKKVDNALYDGAAGDGWFKIWDHGYDQNWCTVKMSNGGGLLTVNLPQGLVGGHYLVRPELLALHNANQGDPQYYISCAQIYVQSTGSLRPQGTVSIPGYCTKGDVADSWNVYSGPPPSSYVPSGPAPAPFNSGGSSNTAPMGDGSKPAGCVLEVGSNWCGVEVPEYHDQDGCWAAAKNCWDQGDQCWKVAPAVMNNNCNIWKSKCQDMDTQCNNKNFNGPPNKGKDLTPPKSTINPPPPLGPTRSGRAGSQAPTPMKYSAPIPAPSASQYEEPAQDVQAPALAAATTEAVVPQYDSALPNEAPAPAATTEALEPQHEAAPSENETPAPVTTSAAAESTQMAKPTYRKGHHHPGVHTIHYRA